MKSKLYVLCIFVILYFISYIIIKNICMYIYDNDNGNDNDNDNGYGNDTDN